MLAFEIVTDARKSYRRESRLVQRLMDHGLAHRVAREVGRAINPIVSIEDASLRALALATVLAEERKYDQIQN